MGRGSSSLQVPRNNTLAYHNLLNRLAEANPELGAEILYQRKRFQNVTQIRLPASIRKNSVHLVSGTKCTCAFQYDSLASCVVTVLQGVRENSAHKLTWYASVEAVARTPNWLPTRPNSGLESAKPSTTPNSPSISTT